MTTVNALWGVSPEPAMLADKYYKEGTIPVSAPDLVVGLELEIESWAGENRYRGFEFKEDGSLRGSAIEAVTKPTKARYVETLLAGFFKHNDITEDNYSERCGTHVHMNVSDLTLDQLGTFCLLYQVFEKTLFKYAGVDRDSSIFCVPWEQAGVSYDLLRYLRNGQAREILRGWRKYTALNLNPVTTFGSVEFRHLPGTCDVEYMVGWINIIGCMYNYSKAKDYKEVQQKVIDLNTSSAYTQFANEVFGLYTQLLTGNTIQEDMETGVINVKLMSMNDLKSPAVAEKPRGGPALPRWDIPAIDNVLPRNLNPVDPAGQREFIWDNQMGNVVRNPLFIQQPPVQVLPQDLGRPPTLAELRQRQINNRNAELDAIRPVRNNRPQF